jgi:hypothetical protein
VHALYLLPVLKSCIKELEICIEHNQVTIKRKKNQTDIFSIFIENNCIYLKDSERRSTTLLINKKVPLVHAGNEIELIKCTKH